ncbi:MAG: class I SAM-dependent methyltransferase [Pirellulales bacterium]|nr:class I SAM-dependent methyltransferase [Pirellulales bacterium]
MSSAIPPAQPSERPLIVDPALLRQATLKNLDAHTTHRGQIEMPCAPAALEHYMARLCGMFQHMGRALAPQEASELRHLVAENLRRGYDLAPTAKLVVQYEIQSSPTLTKSLKCQVTVSVPSLTDHYRTWTETKSEALFGANPDARVMAVAAEIADPRACPVLDVGAGTGRNSLPLARLGFPVDAVEMTVEFADRLEAGAASESLSVHVLRGDLFDPATALPTNHYRLALLSEVVSHFRSYDELRRMLTKLSDSLVPEGLLLFNIFLTADHFEPEPLLREMSQVAWASLYTTRELNQALEGLPLTVLSNDSVVEYEHAHLPREAWPPTGWFMSWTTGKAITPLERGYPPIDMRWILCRRL